jgi:hypothetical protein
VAAPNGALRAIRFNGGSAPLGQHSVGAAFRGNLSLNYCHLESDARRRRDPARFGDPRMDAYGAARQMDPNQPSMPLICLIGEHYLFVPQLTFYRRPVARTGISPSSKRGCHGT